MKKILMYIDIKDSRKISDRKLLMEKGELLENFVELNSQNIEQMAIWKGIEEYMLMYNNKKSVLEGVLKIQEIFFPLNLRFVLAEAKIENIELPLNKMDDEVFIFISEKMKELKKSPINISINFDNFKNSILEIAINSIYYIKSTFTELQMKVYILLQKGKTQIEIADQQMVSQQYVSKVTKQIDYSKISYLENDLLSNF